MPPAGGRGCGDCFCAAARHIAFFKKNAAFRRQRMRGVRPRAAGPFSDARKGTKSAFKGRRPLKNPQAPRQALMLRADLHPLPPPGDGGRCTAVQYLTFFEKCAAGGTGMPGPVRADGLFFACAKSKVKSTHKGEAPLCIPPEGCPPLAGWKGHACQCPPRPVFCPDRPRPLDPGRTAEPLYTVLERTGAQGLPGRGIRGGGTAP